MREPSRFERVVNPEVGELLRHLHLDVRFRCGRGSWLYADDGRAHLDFIAAYGALPLGHGHPAMAEALRRFVESGEPNLVQPSALAAAGELGERLLALAPGDMRRVCFANSGAEAVEAAIKAVRAATGRRLIVTADRSFHGLTLGALSATAQTRFQAPFGELVPGFVAVPYGDLEAMQAVFAEHAGEIAGVMLEPIQGEGGVNLPPAGYLAAVRALCDEADALLVFDEVQTGLGRTGALFACEAEGVQADVLTLAKALGGGVMPIGACLLGERACSRAFALGHASTFAGNALACRVSLAFLDQLAADDFALLANVRARAEQLLAGQERIRAHYSEVLGEVRGRGLLQGLRLDLTRARFGRGWGTLIGVLAEQNNLLPLFASYLLNVEGIRTAPTLNQNPVLRIEPPLTVSAEECGIYLDAMERAVGVLATGDAKALLGHLVGRAPTPPVPAIRAVRPAHASPSPDEPRFAFLIHPLDAASYVQFDASVRPFGEAEIESLADRIGGNVRPFVHASTRIESRNGASAFGEFVCVPFTAEQLVRMPEAEAGAAVSEAIDLAAARSAQLVGLGGFTSIVMRGGTRALDRGVAITTGNSYTVVSAIEAVERAATGMGTSLKRSAAAVVGAAGSVGGTLSGLLMERVGRLVMVGNPNHPDKTRRRLAKALASMLPLALARGTGELATALRVHPAAPRADAGAAAFARFAERLLEENGARVPLVWSVDLAAAVADCPVVVTATSSTEELIRPDMLLPGALVCDLSRPANASRRIAAERPDVLVIDGGVVEVPGRPDLGFDFGFPRGVGYACMAETMMLALERRFEHASIGAAFDPDMLNDLRALAARHGFALAGLRSFDRPLDEAELSRRRAAQRLVA